MPEYARAENSPARRFVWYPEDITVIHRGDVVEDETPTKELDLAQCWRDDCYHRVSREDPVGLCQQCIRELRDL